MTADYIAATAKQNPKRKRGQQALPFQTSVPRAGGRRLNEL